MYWLFIDLKSAYDNVKHRLLKRIMRRNIEKTGNEWGALVIEVFENMYFKGTITAGGYLIN